MNTIIIHPNNRVRRTPEHDLSDILIAPVSRWYRKPTPWWVDRFEEVGLYPIVEADEIAEQEETVLPEETVIEDERVEGVNSVGDVDAFDDVESNACTDKSDVFENVILVDEVHNDDEDEDEDEGDDTVMDVTFTGRQAMFILRAPAQIVEDHERELDLEDEEGDDDEDVFGWDYTCDTHRILQ